MDWIGDHPGSGTGKEEREDRSRRVCAAGLVTMRVRSIDQGLIGEIQFGCPVDGGTARELLPLLVHHTGNGVTIARHEEFAGNIGEMFLVVGPAQTGGQLKIFYDIVIDLAETGIGVQCVGILAEEIIVTFIVEVRNRVWVDIVAAENTLRYCRIWGPETANQTILIVGYARNPGEARIACEE